MRKKLYILDVSGFLFRAYFALPPMSNAKGEATHALFGFIRSVVKLFKEMAPDHIVAVFDGPDNKKQRLELYEKYKAQRTRIYEDLPQQMEWAKTFCDLIGFSHVEIGGVEADDAMGSIAKWAKENGMDAILCTSDKDLAQLVGPHVFVLNPWKDNLVMDAAQVEEQYGVPPHLITDLLALTGDASDNIPGIKGIGPKTAVSLLKEFGSLENLLNNLEKVSGTKKQIMLKEGADMARLSKRLATIHEDLDFFKDPTFFLKKPSDPAALKDFYIEMSFHSLIPELEATILLSTPPEITNYQLVDDPESFKALLTLLENAQEIAFDVEATSIRPLLAEPVGIAFCIKEKEAYYIPFNGTLGQNYVLHELKPIFQNQNINFIGHHAKHDLHVLKNVGSTIRNLKFDTILASYLLHSSSGNHSIDHLALQYFSKVKMPIKSLIGSGRNEISMKDVPFEKMKEYCCQDVDYTFRMKKILSEQLTKRNLNSLYTDLELPLSHVLAKMERAGVYLDINYIKELSKEVAQEISILENEIYELAQEKFNINSPKQLAAILFEKLQIKPIKKTATGLSTSAEVLEILALTHPIAAKILSYRALEKLRSTYIDPLPQEINPKTGRIHPTFNQFITATGRLACQNPNLQNIPIRTSQGKKIRKAFQPDKEEWCYLAADYSQIELRLLAHLSDDSNLIRAFNEGEDIHTFTASLVLNIPIENVTYEERNQAKAINFGIIYGQQAYGLSQTLGIDIHEASHFIKAYFERYPSVAAFIESCIKSARETGQTLTMTGRQREIPEIYSSNSIIRAAGERLAVNTPLQGTAADIIKKAMLIIDKELERRNLKSFLILQIHDELIFEAPNTELEELKELVKSVMEGVMQLKVPLVVDIAIGKNWAEC